jgi:hypothetical protein
MVRVAGYGLRIADLKDLMIRRTREKRTEEPDKSEPKNRRMSNNECRRVESLQAWGFALRATTPQVAFGYDPTGRSVFFLK